jgi:hypothetical protein
MIIVKENIFTESECHFLISCFYKNTDCQDSHDLTKVINLNKLLYIDRFKTLVDKVSDSVKESNANAQFDWGDLVRWPNNSYQNYHTDTAKEDTILTSITYLNSTFMGGETVFKDGITINPKIGRTVIFDGKRHCHRVAPISSGSRYTIAIWYKSLF